MDIATIGWVLLIGLLIVIASLLIIAAIKQAMSPLLTVNVVVVDKYIRTSETDSHYIVFDALNIEGGIETSIGDNGHIALDVGYEEFKLILLRESGCLTFKGSRFIGFECHQQ